MQMMKTAIALVFSSVVLLGCFGCSGPGGPAQRAGAAVDTAVYKVGEGISKAGQKIEGVAKP
jgi:predicted small secreted protein